MFADQSIVNTMEVFMCSFASVSSSFAFTLKCRTEVVTSNTSN
jgi:hypothetical protein